MAPQTSTCVLVPAAGQGTRLGGRRKQFRLLGEAPLLVQTLRRFDRHPLVTHLVAAGPSGEVEEVGRDLRDAGLEKLHAVVEGGATRQESVGRALAAAPEGCEVVLVHDAVRPFVGAEQVQAVIEAVVQHGAAALAVPVADTLRRAADARFDETVPRDGLWRMQTPQGFRRDLFAEAHALAREHGWQATDDMDLVQRTGHPVHVVEGSPLKFKVTTPADWTLAQQLWPLMHTRS